MTIGAVGTSNFHCRGHCLSVCALQEDSNMMIHPLLASVIDIGDELLALTQRSAQQPSQDPDGDEEHCLGCDAWVDY